MSEMIRSVMFEHFRGLPGNTFDLKGKKFVLLGSNGKGKTAFVDGFEFLFSGKIGRFIGSGTGSIDHDEALKHVKKLGIPKVFISLIPSNGNISRDLGSEFATVTDKQAIKDYFEQHSRIDSFVLRRAQILEFIFDKDADRYQKLVRLLGITKVDTMQRVFVDAARQTRELVQSKQSNYLNKLAAFNDPVADFQPNRLDQIFDYIADTVNEFGLEKITKWAEIEERLTLLKAKRPESNKDKIDSITRALVSLESPLPLSVKADSDSVNQLWQKLEDLKASSVEAPRNNIITEGLTYLSTHTDEENCPLCEKPFDNELSVIISRLKQRRNSLHKFRDTETKCRSGFTRIQQYASNISEQLHKDLDHEKLLDPETRQLFRNARASALLWLRQLRKIKQLDQYPNIIIPARFSTLSEARVACAKKLKAQKETLVQPDTSKLEAAIILLERGKVSHSEIADHERNILVAEEIARRATIANDIFSKAREAAIQQIFDQIATTVLDYYRRLHNCEDENERSECSQLEIKPTSRAAAGGLRLAVQFLGITEPKDPRTYLSEGHLDSLGLCLFLASVRIFNPPGSLLVLDDVLTSIDKEHRRRVGELLIQEFDDYQIILTTHDEHWYNLLISSVRARGVQSNWRFMKIEHWDVDSGPSISVVDSSWDFVMAYLNETNYRELGGPFRYLLEDFLKRTAAKLEIKVKFKIDGKYTAGDFVASGIQDQIRDNLVRLEPESEKEICADVARVFGQGDLVNFLSHNNPGRLEVTFDQAVDFVHGLKSLTKRCEDHKLIKGR